MLFHVVGMRYVSQQLHLSAKSMRKRVVCYCTVGLKNPSAIAILGHLKISFRFIATINLNQVDYVEFIYDV